MNYKREWEVMFYVIFKSKLFFVTRIIVTMFKLKEKSDSNRKLKKYTNDDPNKT